MEVVGQLIEPPLNIGDIGAQVEDKGLDALGQFGQHKGEHPSHHQDQRHIGGDHRQGPGGSSGGGLSQRPAVQPEKEMAGPVENEGQGKADDQGPEQPQYIPHSPQHHVQPGQRDHQHHRVGDDEQDTFEESFVHNPPLVHIRNMGLRTLYHPQDFPSTEICRESFA